MFSGSNGAGKGDKPRQINKKKFDENWDKIFGKEKNGKKKNKSNKKNS